MFKGMNWLLVFIFVVSFTFSVQAEEGTLTKGKLAELIIENTDLELPAGTKDLSDDEYYEVLFNILASSGMTMFAGAKSDEMVSYDEFLPTLYLLSGGDANATPKEKMGYLAEHGYIPADFLVVESVRAGIQEYFDKNEVWPSELDAAINGIASADNPFFTMVLQQPVDTAWVKNALLYTTPSTGAVYTYDPATGNFMSNANVDLRFAVEVLSNKAEAFTSFQRPDGEPKEDKELIDA